MDCMRLRSFSKRLNFHRIQNLGAFMASPPASLFFPLRKTGMASVQSYSTSFQFTKPFHIFRLDGDQLFSLPFVGLVVGFEGFNSFHSKPLDKANAIVNSTASAIPIAMLPLCVSIAFIKPKMRG